MKNLKIKCHYEGLSECFVAGGAILSQITKTPINDWDIYPKSFDSIISNLDYLIEEEQCQIVHYSNNAITLKSSLYHNDKGDREIIQIMIFDNFDSPEKIFENFDFTVCMSAYDMDQKTFHCHPDFLLDVASRTLKINEKTKYPHATLVRLKKYTKKGYEIPKSQLLKLACVLNNTTFPSSWEDLEKAIGGVYGKILKLETKDLEYNVDNVYKLLDEIDTDKILNNFTIEQEEDTITKLLKSEKHSEKTLALKILRNEEIPLLKISGGYVFYDTDKNKIYGDHILFKNVDIPEEYNIKNYENLLISGYVIVTENVSSDIVKLYDDKHESIKLGDLVKSKSHRIILDLCDTIKSKAHEKGYKFLEVLVNSDDISSIKTMTNHPLLISQLYKEEKFFITANRFKTMEIVKNNE